jgi:hypothetical protein
MPVHPLRLDMHIDKEPPSASTFPIALEGGLDVFRSAVAKKRQSNPGQDNLLISNRGIEVLEYADIWCNPQPAFTQHHEALRVVLAFGLTHTQDGSSHQQETC